MPRPLLLPPIAALVALVALSLPAATADVGCLVSERVKRLTRDTPWRRTGGITVRFNTHHPQGLARIGDRYYVSSVEVLTPARRYPTRVGGYDRDAGAGKGHLFAFDGQGALLADLPLGEGSIYHPGGIDFDGTHIWIPVAEYRPDSRSIVYRLDPKSMKVEEVFRHGDHIGAIVHDRSDGALHGVSWGGRRFYRWPLGPTGEVTNANVRAARVHPNPSHYIDYQDCKSLGRSEMVCGGIATYQPRKDGPRLALGGLEIVDLVRHVPAYQVPVELWTDSGLPMTQNPFWIEPAGTGLRAYFMPEDRKSTIYIYEIDGTR